MNHVGAMAEMFWTERTPFVLLAFFIVRALVKNAKNVERYHTRAAGTLIGLHIVAISVAAVQSALDYESAIAETVGLAFSLLAVVSLGVTLVFRVLLPRVGITLPRILIDLVTAVCTIVVFIIIGKRAGFSIAGLITTSAVLTAVIGFSLQDTLGSVMGGLSLQLDKSVSVGDWITLGPGQPTGRVVEIRWRYTSIETRNWETVIIPNSQLVKSQVTILGRRTGEATLLRRHVEFFVDFRTPPTDVIAACEAALKADPVPRMASTPAPHVVFFGVRDSYGVYAVRYWLEDLSADDGTDSAVRIRIWFALRRANIQLSIPASTVFLTHETKERDERKEREERQRRLAALASVDLFSGLPRDARRARGRAAVQAVRRGRSGHARRRSRRWPLHAGQRRRRSSHRQGRRRKGSRAPHRRAVLRRDVADDGRSAHRDRRGVERPRHVSNRQAGVREGAAIAARDGRADRRRARRAPQRLVRRA